MKAAIKRMILRWKYRKHNVKFAPRVQLGLHSRMEGCNRIGKNSFFSGALGYASYIGEDCHMEAKIGRFCSIASRVVTVRGNHPTKIWASTHPVFFSPKKQCGVSFVTEEKFQEMKPMITIGNDVWIGDSVLLVDGITIGDGAVIAAGAVVTKDVAPYTIVGGVPAKVIKTRFPEPTIQKLLQLKWWTRPVDWLAENATLFADVDSLLEKIENEGDMQ